MAYGNYEGKAFRDGEHFHDGCDAHIRVAGDESSSFRSSSFHTFHVVLGQGRVRVALQKTTPRLLIADDDGMFSTLPLEGAMEYDGYRCYGQQVPGSCGAVTLIEPDGTVWTGMAAYEEWDHWCEEDRV